MGEQIGQSSYNPNLNSGKPQQPLDPSLASVNKPNPYVIVEASEEQRNDGQKKEVVFKYPKSKIFVGGLDFKLTNEDLK